MNKEFPITTDKPKCLFCHCKKDLSDDGNSTIFIQYDKSGGFRIRVSIDDECSYDWVRRCVSKQIKFCPMCGRELIA